MQILSALGFELGSEAQITEEWEYRFDHLQEVLLQVVSLIAPKWINVNAHGYSTGSLYLKDPTS